MFDALPVEIIQQIAGHLPTAQSITSLLATNRNLQTKYSVDPHVFFRSFVQKTFPTATTTPLWRDAACALTSRARAWDRKALSVRHVAPSTTDDLFDGLTGARLMRQASFCGPVIDSYSDWLGPSWSADREVLAWSLFGRVLLRVSNGKQEKWSAYSSPLDDMPLSDISDMRLLRPNQRRIAAEEILVFGRADGHMGLVSYNISTNEFQERKSFAPLTNLNRDVYRFDVSLADTPLVARSSYNQIDLFPVTSPNDVIKPIATLKLASDEKTNRLMARAIKFVSPSVVACSLRDRIGPPPRSMIYVHNLSPTGFTDDPLVHLSTAAMDDKPGVFTRCLANMPSSAGSRAALRSNLVLSGWTDSTVLIHDVRTTEVAMKFEDHVDALQVSSILAIDDKRFLAASDGHPCLRVHDIRMPRHGMPYGNLDLTNSSSLRAQTPHIHAPGEDRRGPSYLLSIPVPRSGDPNRAHYAFGGASNPTALPDRYKGPIFSLSTPSSYSTTVYAGIELGVLKLDFHNTDDVLSNIEHTMTGTSTVTRGVKRTRKFWDVLPAPEDYGLKLRPSRASSQSLPRAATQAPASRITNGSSDLQHLQELVAIDPTLFPLPIASYLRPRPSHMSSDHIYLRKQLDWQTTVRIWREENHSGREQRDKLEVQEHRSNLTAAPETAPMDPTSSSPSPRQSNSQRSPSNQSATHRHFQDRVREQEDDDERWDVRWRLAGDKDLPNEYRILATHSRSRPVRDTRRADDAMAAANAATSGDVAGLSDAVRRLGVADGNGARGQGRWRGRGRGRGRGSGRGGERGGVRSSGIGDGTWRGRGRGDSSGSGPSRGRGEG